MSIRFQQAMRRAESQPARSRAKRDRRMARRHDEAIIDGEVRRLARALRPYGVLHRDALEQAADARRWHEGGFDSALDAAVRAGAVHRLPAGFYRTPSLRRVERLRDAAGTTTRSERSDDEIAAPRADQQTE